jgi:hypothetical protein
MFFPRTRPIALRPEGLLGIRFSLNTPVIERADVPNGPARAAIAVHVGESGGRALSIGIRSLRSSSVALFGFRGDLDSERSVFDATEAALSFCEGMGFLFDDDEIEVAGPEAREEALHRWRALTQTPDEAELDGEEADALPEMEAEQPSPEILDDSGDYLLDPDLDVLREPDLDALPEPAAIGSAAGTEPIASDASPTLSKFQMRSPAPPTPEAEDPRGAALARIPLMKRRRSNEAADERPSFLLRILSGF